ncbi:MAG: hypothetical protein LBV04_05070 [Deferribacteraceae bacterium]|jgi:UDPglucose 6-dehydrogenase|nr:hypothetical protein [Deferribacteraceae bacterium]
MKRIVGILGCGVIGNALRVWLEKNTEHTILINDPFKGFHDNLSESDVIFVNIHIPTDENGKQEIAPLNEIIKNLPNKPIFIRTTVLPGTSDCLSKEFGKDVNFLPEFLTERTAVTDFQEQPMVFTSHIDILKDVFKGKKYIEMSSYEAELGKYAHNVFGALKVTFFNAICDMTEKYGADFQKVRQAALLSGYINEMHTNVPGPDGAYGYGGKCFPKDTNAFAMFTKDLPIGKLLENLACVNENFRAKLAIAHGE